MLVIGLTGGIASGKSLVSARFESLGAPVIDADLLAREVVQPGTDGLSAIVAHFSDEVLSEDGTLDRTALRERVFADPADRAFLDACLHPLIRTLSEERLRAAAATQAAYAVYAVPLLVETGQQARFDRIAVVDVPAAVQLERLMRRDGMNPQGAQRMLDAQASRHQRLAVADDIIDNAGPIEATHDAVDRLDARYRARPPVS